MPVYLASMKPQTIINGFRRAGLFPFNSDNLDWSKCEGNERQQEAFHPDESINVQNLVNQGTQSLKPNVINVKVQTSLSGGCRHLDLQHMDRITAKHQDDMILHRKEDPAVLCGILARARAWLNQGTVVPSKQVPSKQSWRIIIPSAIPWESQLNTVDEDPEDPDDPDESDDQDVILPLTFAPGDTLIIPSKYKTDRSRQTSRAVSQPISPTDR